MINACNKKKYWNELETHVRKKNVGEICLQLNAIEIYGVAKKLEEEEKSIREYVIFKKGLFVSFVRKSFYIFWS